MALIPRLYLDGVNVIKWADPKSLDLAALSFNQASTFSVTLHRMRPRTVATPISAPLPVTPLGGMSLLYMVEDTADITGASNTYIAGGNVEYIEATNSAGGAPHKEKLILKAATPMRYFNRVMEYVGFDAVLYDNDVARVIRLMELADLPGVWDFTSGISGFASISYPAPPEGEAVTEYFSADVRTVLEDIASDPGQPTDTDFPVPIRRWWITPKLADPTDPTEGIEWVLHYRAATDMPNAAQNLTDDALSDPLAAVYNGWWAYPVDYSDVIRSATVAGPRTPARLAGWKTGTGRIGVDAGHGHIRKAGDTSNAWGDGGAVSLDRTNGNEWEAVTSTQEFIHRKDTFRRDDSPSLGRANQGGDWIDLYPAGEPPDGVQYPRWTIEGQQARPRWSTVGAEGMAIAVQECGASTGIARMRFSNNDAGAALVFRATNYTNHWRLENTGTEYLLIKRVAGVDTTVDSTGTGGGDDDIKVSMKDDELQVFVNEGAVLIQVNDAFNQDATKHGIAHNLDAAGAGGLLLVDDWFFSTVWADKAFGLGTAATVNHYNDILYGFLFNLDATVDLLEEGVVVEAEATDYTYNDQFKIEFTYYAPSVGAALLGQIRWYKKASDDAHWELLRTQGTDVPIVTKVAPLYVQTAFKHMGGTFTNITVRKPYSNVFDAGTEYSAIEGYWPAPGTYQSDALDTYHKRYTYAQGVFREQAEPKRVFTCTTRTRFVHGTLVKVTNAERGWAETPTDTRPTFAVTEVKRVENPANLKVPQEYILTLGDNLYKRDDRGRRHILKDKEKSRKATNKGLPTISDDILEWPDPTEEDQNGGYMEVAIMPIQAEGWEDAQWPSQRYDAGLSRVRIPPDMQEPGRVYGERHRRVPANGEPSDWSDMTTYVVPPRRAYERPYSIEEHIGDGVAVITTGSYDEVRIPESGVITAWAVSSDVDGDIVVDVCYATAHARRTLGPAAYASIADPQYPNLVDQSYLESVRLNQWTTTVTAGDWILFKVLSASTVKRAHISLFVTRSSST